MCKLEMPERILGSHQSSDTNMMPPPASLGMDSQRSRINSSSDNLDDSNSRSSSRNSITSGSESPSWLKWSAGLDNLLDDPDGKDLFEKYLNEENCSTQLYFLWACEGLKCTASEEPSQVPILIRTIYHHFIKTSVLLGISPHISSQISHSIITEGKLDEVTVFDQASKQVRSHMEQNLYPNFLQSEIYLSAIPSNKTEQENPINSNTQHSLLPPSSPLPELPPKPFLQTVLEDAELKDVNLTSTNPPQVPRRPDKPKPKKGGLTIKALQASEFERVSVPVAESRRPIIPSKPVGTSSVPHPYHAAYSSYNPVSAADSEAQSQSSGGTQSSGRSGGSSRRHCCSGQVQRSKGVQGQVQGYYPHPPQSHSSNCCAHQKSSSGSRQGPKHVNGDNGLKVMLPEGYGRKRINPPPSNPIEFVNLLFPKLEDLKRKREHGNVLADAISRINLVQDDNEDEGILDEHVSRVFHSPGQKSPLSSRRRGFPAAPPSLPASGVRPRRVERGGDLHTLALL